LRGKINWQHSPGLWSDMWPPLAEKLPHACLVNRVPLRCWVWNPKVDLEISIRLRANVRPPSTDSLGLHEQRAATTKPTSVGHSNGKRGGAGPSHRCHQDRN